MKRPKLSGLSDCMPATEEDEETSTKRPKLMEADESASMHDPQASSSTEVAVWCHCRLRRCPSTPCILGVYKYKATRCWQCDSRFEDDQCISCQILHAFAFEVLSSQKGFVELGYCNILCELSIDVFI